MEINSNTNGIRELTQAFERYPDVFTRHMKLALNQNLREVQVEAKQNHRFISRNGNLEKAIVTKDADNSLSGGVYLDLGISRYANWVHEGTRPHQITPVNRKSLRWATGGGFKFAKKVMHPGTKPDQFVYQALERKESSIMQRYGDALNKARLEVGL